MAFLLCPEEIYQWSHWPWMNEPSHLLNCKVFDFRICINSSWHPQCLTVLNKHGVNQAKFPEVKLRALSYLKNKLLTFLHYNLSKLRVPLP